MRPAKGKEPGAQASLPASLPYALRLSGFRGEAFVMRNIIIGTAGHVDHGKTALIKALTGIDTDRWEEEKRRGLSIGLGFASFQLPDGSRAGIIDVPGHERFIRNMLTGVWGMDLILLVIDAVEGVRPQTVEHLNIIDLLGISTGVVVITKIDMVSETQVEAVVEQARSLVKDKLLNGSPLVRVSAITGQGIDELKETIIQQIASVKPPQRSLSAPRLPIDRVFVMSGFGAVVTGTLIGGSIGKQAVVNIMPSGTRARVRGIEVHGEQVENALQGQRVALNLSGVTKQDIKRGDVVCDGRLSEVTDRVDTVLRIVDSCERVFENWIRVRFYLGTSEVFGRAVLLSADEGLLPDDVGYVQFRLEKPVFAFRGDRFIVRDFTNQETLGGGQILNPFPSTHKRLSEETIQQLKKWESADDSELVRLVADTSSSVSIQENTARFYLPYSGDRMEELLKQMEEQGIIVRYISGDKRLIASVERMTHMKDKILAELSRFHEERPLAEGVNYSKTRSQLDIDEVTFDLLLQELIEDGEVSRRGNILGLTTHQMTFTDKELKISGEIERIFLQKGFSTPSEKELVALLDSYSRDDVQDVFQALLRRGKLIRISSDIVLHAAVVEKAVDSLKKFLQQRHQITVSEFRQLVNTSRKYAVPFMEYCDATGFTIREGNFRKLKDADRAASSVHRIPMRD
jgi:selenocysteine-specific elongation factor